ncbi:ras guanine nucleotide exchange factor domain-containing protein [Obelidium mucronatum]|nr:ras guanine nucleotide exchange factor domain-containing protein [Obelidium mucronatum]
MNFKTQGGADNFDSDEDDDDFGMLSASRGPGIQVGKQLSDPQYEIDEDGGTAVKSGSLPCLTALLWSNISAGGADQKLISDFLMTYRYFAISQDVARLLALSYLEVEWWANLKTSSNQADSEDTLNHSLSYPISKFIDDLAAKYSNGSKSDEWAGFLQLRILNVLKKWIDLYPDDFTMNKDLLDFTLLFLEKKVERDVKRAKHGTAILSNLKQKVKEYELNRYGTLRPHNHSNINQVLLPQYQNRPATAPWQLQLTRQQQPPNQEAPPRHHKSKKTNHHPGVSAENLLSKQEALKRESLQKATLHLYPLKSQYANSPQISKTPLRQHSRSTSHQIVEDDEEDDASNSNSNTAASKKKPMSLALSIAAALNEMEPPLAPPKKFSEFDPTLVAKQITLLEHSHFRKIKIDEFYGQAWAKKKAGSGSAAAAGKSRLVAFINWFNRVAYGVATEVVKPQVIKERVTMLKRFIFIAELCVKWNNYNTAFEIVAGLNLGPVSRLAKTWKALPTKYVDVWNKLNKIVSSESSYRAYRQLMNQFNQFSPGAAVLPYLGVNLSDLTFTEDGNPSYNSDDPATGERIINFSKFRMISKILGGILKSQVGQYDFVFDDDVQRWLKNEWEAASSKELYDMSLLCEPRAAS